MANEIVNAVTGHYNTDKSALPITLNDLLGYTAWGHITSDDLNKIRKLVVNANPSFDTDAFIFDLAARLGPRTELGYRDYRNNAFHQGICAYGYTQGSFYAETQPSWNAEPGDGLITRNMNHPLAELFKSTGIVFTHAGMATGPYGVRHNTSYMKYLVNHLVGTSEFGWDTHIEPQYLYQSLPGTITENLDGSFCKDLDPATCNPATGTSVNNSSREFDGANTLLLTTSNSVTRNRLRRALDWAQKTNMLYSVHGFSDGTYHSGYNVCSTFVRDALLSEYSYSEFDSSVIANPPEINWVTLGLTKPNTVPTNGSLPEPSQILKRTYNADYKAFWYLPSLRASGAKTLYEHIFSTAKNVAKNSITNTVDNTFKDVEEYSLREFMRDLLGRLLGDNPLPPGEHIGIQMVNCFAFNDCANYTTPPANSYDATQSYSLDEWRPEWPQSYFESAIRPVKEGWAFSADDLLYVSNPYDRFEKLVRIDSEIISTNYCDNNGNCIPNVSQVCNQNDGIDMLTKTACYSDMDLISCVPTSTCQCDFGKSCACLANLADWVNIQGGIEQTNYSYNIEFTNDSTSTNLTNAGCDKSNPSTCTSIYGDVHGWFLFPEFTADIKQVLDFVPYSDKRDYASFVENKYPVQPVELVPVTKDIYKNTIGPASISVLPGDRISVLLQVVYGWDTQVIWIVTVNSAPARILTYILPHLNPVGEIDHTYTASLYRAHQMVVKPWRYQ